MNAQSQISDFNASQVEIALRVARISLDSFERVLKLQLDSAKTSLEEGTQLAKAVSGIHDFQDAIEFRQKAVENFVEQSLGFYRSLYDITAQTQSELSSLAEERAATFNKSVFAGMEKLAKGAPAGADIAVAAVKSTVHAAAAAVDSITKTAKQVADFANASVKAASSATADAVKAASRSAKHHSPTAA